MKSICCYYLYLHPQNLPAVGCGYYYIVSHGAFSHTAFRTKKALKTWLSQTGLKIGKRNNYRSVRLVGDYDRTLCMMNTKEFFNTYGHLEPFYALDNGSYSIGFIDRREDGNILLIQNPNTDRPILDYQKVRKHLETGTPIRFIY